MESSAYEPIDHSGFLPVKVFVTAMDKSGYHWHYDYELVVVLKGHLQVLCRPNPFRMGVGDIFLVNSKVVHGYGGYEDNLCLFIQFSPCLLDVGMEKVFFYHFHLNSAVEILKPKVSYFDLVCAACRIGFHSRREGKFEQLRACSELYSLLSMIVENVPYEIRRYSVSSFREPEDDLIMKISRFIDDNASSENLVESICRIFGLSKKTLYRYSKSMLGLSPKVLVDIARVEKAKEQLRNKDIPISMISDICGYSNETTFYRVFKKMVGITPGEYRNGAEGRAVNRNIQGYMSYSDSEADKLLKKYASGMS
jgi:AraC-like DNA-binding protein